MASPTAASVLKEIVARPECPGCVVITSPDQVRRERALAYLLQHIKKNSGTPTTFAFGEQGRSDPSRFLQDLREPSLFEPTRFAVMRSINLARAADVEPVSDFLQRDVPGVHLFLVGDALPNTPTFKKVLEKKAVTLAFEALKGAELSRWVEREVKQSGITGAGDDVISLLLSLGNDDPEAIGRLIEKFSLYLGDTPASAAALRALEPGRTIASDFELAETLLGKNRAATEALLLQLLNQGSSPFMLIGLLTKTFSTIFRLRLLLDKGLGQGAIKTDLGLSPWLFSKYLPLARKLSAESLSSILSALAAADFRLKDRSLGPNAIFSSLASQISRSI
jgi:hypothetical protein